jgi:molybdopterin synthase catalytic subunit
MSFDEKERKSAQSQVFNIQHFTGVLGDVSHSSVQVYHYSSLHQTLKQQNVPQEERNKLENIMDELKTADPTQKKSLLEKGKAWIVKNQKFLGASASIVRKALGIDVG